jgi:hypothetical protein
MSEQFIDQFKQGWARSKPDGFLAFFGPLIQADAVQRTVGARSRTPNSWSTSVTLGAALRRPITGLTGLARDLGIPTGHRLIRKFTQSVPRGSCLSKARVDLGPTHPFAQSLRAAALAAIETMRADDLCAAPRRIESVMRPRLAALAEKYDVIGDVRGRGRCSRSNWSGAARRMPIPR